MRIMSRRKWKRWVRRALWVVASPFILFFVLAVLLYIPPIQNWVAQRVTAMLSESTGMQIRLRQVRLAFPLDLTLHDLSVCQNEADTILAARRVRLDVRLLPLLQGRADVDGLTLDQVQVDTRSMVSNTEIIGTIGHMEASAHGIAWADGEVHLDHALLDRASLYVALSDTAREEAPDTTAAMPWHIVADDIRLRHTALALSMPGDSMRVGADITQATLRGGDFHTGTGRYAVGKIDVDGRALTYATRHDTLSAPSSLPNEAFRRSRQWLWADYAVPEGLSADYLALTGLRMTVDSLVTDADGLSLRLSQLAFAAHGGLRVTGAEGSVRMDSRGIRVPQLTLRLPESTLTARADIPYAALDSAARGTMDVRLSSAIRRSDLAALLTGYVTPDDLAALPDDGMTLGVRVTGNMAHLAIEEGTLAVPRCLTLTVGGSGTDLMDDARRTLDLRLEANVADGTRLTRLAGMEGTVSVPSASRLKGRLTARATAYAADLMLSAAGGSMTTRLKADTQTEQYAATATARALPLGRLLPGSGLSPFSGSVKVAGRGFDPTALASRLMAEADIERLAAGQAVLDGIQIKAESAGGKARADFSADNAFAKGRGSLTASWGRLSEATLTADIDEVRLSDLMATKDTLGIGMTATMQVMADARSRTLKMHGAMRNIRFLTPRKSIMARDLTMDFATSADTTTARVTAGDLALTMGAEGRLTQISDGLGALTAALAAQMEQRTIDLQDLRATLPVMQVDMTAGQDNPLSKILRFKGLGYETAMLRLRTSPAEGLSGEARVGKMEQGALLIDTINARLSQDTTGINLTGEFHSYTKHNPNKFRAVINAFVHQAAAGVHLDFFDARGRKGIDLGVKATAAEDGLQVSVFPETPVIAYRNFRINGDNYVFLGREHEVRADIDLLADDGTAMSLLGEPTDSINDLTLSMLNVNLSELSDVLPVMPRLGGMLSGDIHITAGRFEPSLSAAALVQTRALEFEGALLGDLGVEAFYLPMADSAHYAHAYISAGDREVMQCEGTYSNDRFAGEAHIDGLPLQMANGFLVGTDFLLDGYAKGDLSLRQEDDGMLIDGALAFDSAHVLSDVYGINLAMDTTTLVMADSRLLFDRFGLRSNGRGNPLEITGSLDLSQMDNMRMSLLMKAKNFELVNTRRKMSSLLYGKVYADFVGQLEGSADAVTVKGKMDILDRTDMTYILKDSPLTVDDRLADLVRFVDLTDTARVEMDEAVAVGGFNMVLGISISDAARFCCNLSEDGTNYVNLEGGGNLTMRITEQGDFRLTGRLTAESGKMKYSLPVIPLKTFDIVPGSYVEFTGDAANPTLNIAAKERVKTTITENDVPRAVAFDVGVAITQPLDRMGLEFTIEAPEDLTMQNQLAAMSADQRSKTAVAMLATGMFMTDDMLTGGTGFKAGNALNAFLQSEIQNIAGNALRTFDLSVGMETGTSKTGTETTDYSFRFAKRFWNDRISVIIGGKVSTGEDADNSAASFIDNIAVEYRLDRSATRYVKVFYDRSTQDPLEGQLTQTGAGLVLRRKTDKLGELFLFRRKKE